MRRMTCYSIRISDDNVEKRYLIKRYKKSYRFMKDYHGITMDIETQSLEQGELENYLAEKGFLYYKEDGHIEFTNEELREMPYFMVRLCTERYVYKDCSDYGTEMKYRCSTCKDGEEIVGFVHIPVIKKIKLNAFLVRPTMIVSRAMKEKLETAGVTGCIFRPIIDSKTKEIDENYFELAVDTILPPVISKTFAMDTCPCCGKVSLRYIGTTTYDKNAFREAKDFYYAKESAYHGGPCGNARSYYLICSRKAAELLGAENIEFYRPIYIEGMYENQ